MIHDTQNLIETGIRKINVTFLKINVEYMGVKYAIC